MSRKCDLLEKAVMSGNNVSHSNRKTRRRFLPNLQQVSFASVALGNKVKLRVATSTLRTVNKYGDIDSFLVNYRFAKLSETARKLRRKITKSLIKKGDFDKVKIVKEKKEAKS